jgi:hypothetical protein
VHQKNVVLHIGTKKSEFFQSLINLGCIGYGYFLL